MTWEPEGQYEHPSIQFNIGNGMGYLLILCGLVVTGFVLLKIQALLVDPQQLVIFTELFPEQLTISWADGHITLPSEIPVYLFPLVLLSMAGGIANGLIQAGINLLRKRQTPKSH